MVRVLVGGVPGKGRITEDQDEWDPDYKGTSHFDSPIKSLRRDDFPAEMDYDKWNYNLAKAKEDIVGKNSYNDPDDFYDEEDWDNDENMDMIDFPSVAEKLGLEYDCSGQNGYYINTWMDKDGNTVLEMTDDELLDGMPHFGTSDEANEWLYDLLSSYVSDADTVRNTFEESYKPKRKCPRKKKKITEAVGDKKYGGTVIGDEETTVGAPKKGLTEAGHYDPVTHEWVTGEDETEAPKANPDKDAYDRIMSMSQYEQDATRVLEQLFDELVPSEGKADTVAGEAVRAMMRLLYRNYNDGDKFFEGYGLETCASPAMWLMNSFDKTGSALRNMLDDAEKLSDNDDLYTEQLREATATLIEELKAMGDEALAPNEGDCLAEDITEIQEAAPTYEYDVDTSGEELNRLIDKGIIDWDDVYDSIMSALDNEFNTGSVSRWARDAFVIEELCKEDYDKACGGTIEDWIHDDLVEDNLEQLEDDEEDYEDEEEE